MYETWEHFLVAEMHMDSFKNTIKAVKEERKQRTVFPAEDDVFNAFWKTHPCDIKAVIIGQDPYHTAGQAHGLAFSVPDGVKLPPSLRNIFKEVDREYGCGIPESGNLTRWAEQGVFLLNSILTVAEGEPGSHSKLGWEEFTDAAIKFINSLNQPIVYMLWGNYAQKKEKLINNPEHLVLKAPHPSPYSYRHGFEGCGHFVLCNRFLDSKGIGKIIW
ncbi:MAG: uracil-DNA glycosylase [Lachnospiraceae bacterium]|nr:uracil-DNA glycosylase [Lachnospiraceae bacterium]